MGLFKDINRVQVILEKIGNQTTGTPAGFAGSIGVSRSMLYVYINELNSMGAGIAYCRRRHTFYFRNGNTMKLELITG